MECNSQCLVSSKETCKREAQAGTINTEGLEALIASNVPMTILDARGGKWDDGKRIASARNLTSDASAEQAQKLIPSKGSLVVLYCSNPECSASGRLATKLSELGYTNLLTYEEGIEAWINSGRKVNG
jgi:rhodanese-related sulfurtransferase